MTNKENTGSTENQVSVITERIDVINTHLKINKKDHSSRRGLLLLVSKRRKLLKYLKRTNLEGYKTLIQKLNIRK
tara:strand:+ start:722 stop:946 length:225 start_codon:yes stop_codon:yes gene_type:complete